MTAVAPPVVIRTSRRRSSRFPGPLAAVAGGYLLVLVVAAVFAPLIAPAKPNENNYNAIYQHPSGAHLLGTDELGRDLLSRVIFGARLSLVGVLEALVVYVLIGLVLGVLAGYVGGILDVVVVWLADVFFAVPQIIVLLAVLAIFPQSGVAAMVALGILGAPGLAMLARGATRAVREEQYVAAARVAGLRTHQILVRHVLPRIAGPVIVQVSLFAGAALIYQTGLDFLGIGTQPPTASWGSMVAEGSNYVARDSWMIMPAGVVTALTIVAFGLVGDAARDSRSDRSSAGAQARSPRIRSAVVTLPAAETSTERAVGATDEHPPLLRVQNLCVGTTIGGDPAPIVQGVSFTLRGGESLGLVGESGCGKSMTAYALMQLLPAGVAITDGSILLDGLPLHILQESELGRIRGQRISMISQEPVASLDPSFTVGSQLAEVVRRHGSMSRGAAREEVLRLLDWMRLPDPRAVARMYPHQLSGGIAQRVAIAAALAGKPSLLIADEPTTALDVTVQAEILDLLHTLRAETGLALILVSHDWGVIADSCDSALVMYAGQVVEDASLDQLFRAPAHPYTRGLMSSNPHFATAPRSLLPSIRGAVPPVGQWPVGCHFAARCDFATPECSASPVALESVGDAAHQARCIHSAAVLEASAPKVGGRHG